jgi:CheY-like chemotaxis protein
MTTKCVLVIDDEDGVREIVQFSLEAVAGWKVLTAASGIEGLSLAEAEHPDAIILDVMMPSMDGPTTFKELQANLATRDIPTIMLTAKARSSEQKELIELGVAGVLAKPFKAMELVSQIQNILHWID